MNKRIFVWTNSLFEMLTRRHLRIKVMQEIYACTLTQNDNLTSAEKHLTQSSLGFYQLYLTLLSLLIEIQSCGRELHKKNKNQYIKASDKALNPKFYNNLALAHLAKNNTLQSQLEKHKLNYWSQHDEYVRLVWDQVSESNLYSDYLVSETNGFDEDKSFLVSLFTEVIAPFERLHEFIEEIKPTWMDDLPLVNTIVRNTLTHIKDHSQSNLVLTQAYKDPDDANFATTLFRKVMLNDSKLSAELEGRTPNWEQDRIAVLDMIILKMAIAELLYFPEIPSKVTINEYLEIAKEYATPKSSVFINGILDVLVKEYSKSNDLNKNLKGLT